MRALDRVYKLPGKGLAWALVFLLLLAAVACGASATSEPGPTAAPATANQSPSTTESTAPVSSSPDSMSPAATSTGTASTGSSAAPAPTVAAQPTAPPVEPSATGRDDVIIVLDDEPPGLNTYHHSQGGRIHRENLNDPLGWFDKDNRQLVPLCLPTPAGSSWNPTAGGSPCGRA